MRDGTLLRLWHRRTIKVVHLGRRRVAVVLAREASPVCKQNGNADAGGVARAAVIIEEGLDSTR